MAEKSAANFVAAVDAARQNALARLIAALGIRQVGTRTARTLAEHFRDLDALCAATAEELTALPDIGPEVAGSIREFCGSEANRELLERFKALGLWPVSDPRPWPCPRPLAGNRILFTALARTPREKAQPWSRRAGGKVARQVSKKLDYLVAGAEPGSKLAKAQALGVTVLAPEAFAALMNEAGLAVPQQASLLE
jgi:DNA ligase (NAD+)